ncbi:Cof-type HAD-IIB family hydrolase [Clostridium gasigenes]|uniref:HAD family hydrolase n=1 Tax=Clostridium gasigenes TaxID=94869 RepID=UPI001C0AB6D3|nr:HAD family hydrolase [Clostridium gasigenes]MBU3132042.1 Cof-type HAD-IIB family hydrolase [Clostridium gasigenes]
MIKLIATDLDGTLLDENGNLPKYFKKTLKILTTNHNIKFIAASGRPYNSLKEDFGDLTNAIILVSDNGALITDCNNIIHTNFIKPNLVKALISHYRKINKENLDIILSCKDTAYIESTNERFIKEMSKYYYKKEVVDNIQEITDDVLKITFCDFDNIKETAKNHFNPIFENELQLSFSGAIWLDITDKHTTKGIGVKKIQEKYVITKGETMAFGDYYNDITLFEKAYYSYAMDNASDFIKSKAKFVAPSNIDHGVIQVLKNKFNIK